MTEPKTKFKIKDLPSLIIETYKSWNRDHPWRLSAVVAYYAVLSLPALLIIIINLVGAIWGKEIISGMLTDEFSKTLGPDVAEAIQSIIKNIESEDKSVISTIIGIAALLFGATGVFYHLQLSLNQVWQIRLYETPTIRKIIFDRVKSFGFVLIIGFLLLISFFITTIITALSAYIQVLFPELIVYIAYAIDIVISIGMISLLFALIFKYLPDAKIRWSTVWLGAIITSVLFVLGKFLLGLYFGSLNPGSTYGAAGSIILILLWVSYSCLILFFGAEFTWVYAKRYGIGIQPHKNAFIENKKRDHQ